MDDQEKQAENKNDKIMKHFLVIFIPFMAILVFLDFLFDFYTLSYQMYFVLLLITVVLLSGSFEHLEITNFLKLHRDIKWYEGEVKKYKEEINRLTTIVNNKVSVVNNNGPASIVPISSENKSPIVSKLSITNPNLTEIHKKIISKYLDDKNISKNNLVYDVAILDDDDISIFSGPVSLYGGYLNMTESEMFFQVMFVTNQTPVLSYSFTIIHLLKSLFHYKTSKKTNVKLHVLFCGDTTPELQNIELIKNMFNKPRMDNLLEIEIINLSDTELSDIQKLLSNISLQSS